MFIIFGSNFFLNFIPTPPPGLAGDYFKVFAASGYMYVVGAMQLLSGLLLLIGRFVPLALTILAAMIFNLDVSHLDESPRSFSDGNPRHGAGAVLGLVLPRSLRGHFAALIRIISANSGN